FWYTLSQLLRRLSRTTASPRSITMTLPRNLLIACLFCALIGCGGSNTTGEVKKDEKEDDHKRKIVGRWELVKSSDENGPKAGDLTVEFTKKGTTTATIKDSGGKTEKKEGTYSVDGETLKMGDKGAEDETARIKKLTDK